MDTVFKIKVSSRTTSILRKMVCVHAVNVKRKTVRIMLERRKLCQQKICGMAEKSLKKCSAVYRF